MIDRKYWAFALGFASILLFTEAKALDGVRNVKSGQEVRIWGVFSCSGQVASVSGMASNGTFTTRVVQRPAGCGTSHGVMNVLFYRSNPGFRGTDMVTVFQGNDRRQIRVNVQ